MKKLPSGIAALFALAVVTPSSNANDFGLTTGDIDISLIPRENLAIFQGKPVQFGETSEKEPLNYQPRLFDIWELRAEASGNDTNISFGLNPKAATIDFNNTNFSEDTQFKFSADYKPKDQKPRVLFEMKHRF